MARRFLESTTLLKERPHESIRSFAIEQLHFFKMWLDRFQKRERTNGPRYTQNTRTGSELFPISGGNAVACSR